MSELFEGIIFRSSEHMAQEIHTKVSPVLSVELSLLEGEIFVLYRNDPRHMACFSDKIDSVTSIISQDVGIAILARYDSRIGHRSAKVFSSGWETANYQEDDEMYVLLDDDGLPINEGPTYTLDQLDPDLEYETSTNAIELGLAHIGGIAWDTLLTLITRQ